MCIRDSSSPSLLLLRGGVTTAGAAAAALVDGFFFWRFGVPGGVFAFVVLGFFLAGATAGTTAGSCDTGFRLRALRRGGSVILEKSMEAESKTRAISHSSKTPKPENQKGWRESTQTWSC